jgi:hypothetical protein
LWFLREIVTYVSQMNHVQTKDKLCKVYVRAKLRAWWLHCACDLWVPQLRNFNAIWITHIYDGGCLHVLYAVYDGLLSHIDVPGWWSGVSSVNVWDNIWEMIFSLLFQTVEYLSSICLICMASPFTIYSKNKIYRKIIEISPILERYLFKIRDISQFREISLLKRDISFS